MKHDDDYAGIDRQDAVQARAMAAARTAVGELELEYKCELTPRERWVFMHAFRAGMIHGVSAARRGTEET